MNLRECILPLKVALRYLFSPKRHAAVNVVSMVAVAGVTVATAAMVVVMSVFNGFANVAESQISHLAPPLEVTPAEGRFIAGADSLAAAIAGRLGCDAMPVVVGKALGVAGSRNKPLTVMGVPDDFVERSGLADAVIDGAAWVGDSIFTYGIASVGTALGLDIRPGDYRFLELYAPRRRGRITSASPGAFRSDTLIVAGVSRLEQEVFDNDLLVVPLATARALFDFADEATSIYVYSDRKDSLQRLMSSNFIISNRYEQFPSTFRMISMEKWLTMALLSFILLISSFNIITTMSMLILEKQPNDSILRAMGCSRHILRLIYSFEGALISLGGAVAGILLGMAATLLQQYFHLIKIGDGNPDTLFITHYPVDLHAFDIAIVLAITLTVGLAGTFLTTRKL